MDAGRQTDGREKGQVINRCVKRQLHTQTHT